MGRDYSYRNLIVWERSQALALRLIRIVRALPNDWAHAVIARQIIASATSIAANIAEGHARFSPGSHRQHLSIAKGSAAETDSWIDLLRRMGSIAEEEERALHQELLWIMGTLTNKIRDLEGIARRAPDQIGETPDPYEYTQAIDPEQPTWPFQESDYSH